MRVKGWIRAACAVAVLVTVGACRVELGASTDGGSTDVVTSDWWKCPERLGGSWTSVGTNSGTPDPIQTHDFNLTYFTMPLAISAKFTFQVGRHRHVYEKLIYLHSSRWLKYLNP